jgi:hypothetical protein
MQRESKRGSVKVFLLAVIIFVATIIIISLVFFIVSPENNPVRKIAENLKLISPNDKNSGEEDIFYNGDELPFGGGSGGGGGGGGGSSETGGNSESNCNIIPILYAISNINRIYNCNEYDGEICLDKMVTCSAEIRNNNNALGGNFELKLYFVEDGKDQSQALKSTSFSYNLGPSEYASMQDYARITSVGIDGAANKDINCLFNTLNVPEEEVCT